jgi:hypothetical protein
LATGVGLGLSLLFGCNFEDEPRAEIKPSLCRPRSVGFRVAGRFSYDGRHDPDCSVDEQGRALMTFTPEDGCPTEPNPWRSCLIARHQDLRAFAAGKGVLEATVCIDGPLPGSLQLKVEYAPDDNGALQKQLVLTALQSWQDPSGGCQRVVFRADDLSLPDRCPQRAGDGLECRVTQKPPTLSLDPSDPALADAQLLLTTTSCEPRRQPAAEHVVLKLSELRFYPDTCFCRESEGCAVGSYCDTDGFAELACCRCSDDCPGICRELGPSR